MSDGCGHRTETGKRGRGLRAGFTLIDVLVAMAVIAVLIGLMIPTLSGVRETARTVVCSSNIRQIGIGMAMYADDAKGEIPFSRNYNKSLANSSANFSTNWLMQLRIAPPTNAWDGVGLLYDRSYCRAVNVYYCPSCRTNNHADTAASSFGANGADVFANYQYRGGSPLGVSNLFRLVDRVGLMADGLASLQDFNHSTGANVVGSDMSVMWFDDGKREMRDTLPIGYTQVGAKEAVLNAWQLIDEQLFK